MTIKGLIAVGLFAGMMATTVGAHPGRTASDGCHYCRTNCGYWGETAGTRHCHGSGNHESGIDDRFMIKTGTTEASADHEAYPHSHERLDQNSQGEPVETMLEVY